MKIPTATKGSEPHRDHQFPLDVFPDRIQEIVMEYKKAFQFHGDWLGLTMLSALAAAIGTGYRLKVRNLHFEPSIIWAILIGHSGSAKTHVIKHLFQPFTDIDNENFSQYEKELALLDATDEKKKGTKPRFFPAVLRNFTFEALAEASLANPRGCIVLSDEILGFTKNMNAYNKGNDEPYYLELFSGGGISTTRKTQAAIHTSQSCINIIGGIQPAKLRDLLTATRFDNGFAQRFLFSFPEAEYQNWNDYEFSNQLSQEYDEIIKGIIKSGNPSEPITLELEPKAWKELIKWQHENTAFANELKDHGDIMAGLRKKWESYVCRFALILQVTTSYCRDRSQPKGIEKEAVLGAIRLFDHFLEYTQKAFDLIERPIELDSLNEASHKFYRSLPERFTTPEAEEAAQKLEIGRSAMFSLLNKNKLFKRIKQGVYVKAVK